MMSCDVYRHTAAELLSELRFYSFSQLRPLHMLHLTTELRRAAKRRRLGRIVRGGYGALNSDAQPRTGAPNHIERYAAVVHYREAGLRQGASDTVGS